MQILFWAKRRVMQAWFSVPIGTFLAVGALALFTAPVWLPIVALSLAYGRLSAWRRRMELEYVYGGDVAIRDKAEWKDDV